MTRYKVTITLPTFVTEVDADDMAGARDKAMDEFSWQENNEIEDIEVEEINL